MGNNFVVVFCALDEAATAKNVKAEDATERICVLWLRLRILLFNAVGVTFNSISADGHRRCSPTPPSLSFPATEAPTAAAKPKQ